MTTRNFNPFQDGYRLINGTKLNDLFKGIMQIPAMAITSLALGSQSAKASVSQSLSLPVTATANTDFTLTPPAGALITSMNVYTTTAYTAVTDAKISVGASAGAETYVAQTSIKAGGVVTLAPVASIGAAAALLSAPATLYIRVTQSGGSTAVGAAKLVVVYTLP